FLITRKVFATVGDPEDYERLKPEAPYTRDKGPKINFSGRVIPSLRLSEWTKTKWVERLPEYEVPKYVIDAAFGNKGNSVQSVKRLMPQTFNVESYGTWFQYLLYVEEEQMRYVLDCALERALTFLHQTRLISVRAYRCRTYL